MAKVECLPIADVQRQHQLEQWQNSTTCCSCHSGLGQILPSQVANRSPATLSCCLYPYCSSCQNGSLRSLLCLLVHIINELLVVFLQLRPLELHKHRLLVSSAQPSWVPMSPMHSLNMQKVTSNWPEQFCFCTRLGAAALTLPQQPHALCKVL